MNPAITLPEVSPQRRWRGRLQLILILTIVIGPMILATAMYQWRFWVPDARNYHGELLGTGTGVADLGVVGDQDKRWQLLVTAPDSCNTDCKQLVYLARQINIGLNREATRATHAIALSQPLQADYDALLKREFPQLSRYTLEPQAYAATVSKTAGKLDAPQLWIVDPHGNLVLRYANGTSGKAILKDLILLLKISRIG
ncbi:conserved protein of unknown function [Pseudomonas marincola]|jgi:hypothetical protein|uniref:Cytochrome oxidase Cu insertion factor, SCO1/SenC/PrrC family n=1 Tax=Pseudomonas marincola TaxID=437900 RepID=A0A653E2K1_9PSED|nr:hypothetical protein [Pseudomonas marincola]CAE6885632.1 conserved protein of unknown function [Pseudomonas marincola]